MIIIFLTKLFIDKYIYQYSHFINQCHGIKKKNLIEAQFDNFMFYK